MKADHEALWRVLKVVCLCLAIYSVGLLDGPVAYGQNLSIPACKVENLQLNPRHGVQVVVLRDPSGGQEAKFDMTHGGSLVSLRYEGRELLYRRGAGTDVEMYKVRHGKERALKGLSPYWSSFDPDQAGSSMGAPATVVGVACNGTKAMKVFAMMIDAGVDSSFREHPLIAVWKGQISQHFPPGYSTPYAIETHASWVVNPGGTPKYYLKLEQRVVNLRAKNSGTMQWFLKANAPWDLEHKADDPSSCSDKAPCQSKTAPVVAAGRYESAAHRNGLAVVVPTAVWKAKRVYVGKGINPYGGAPVVRKRTFGVVLTRSLEGERAFQFSWYLCAGSWKEARAFAQTLPH